MMDEPVGLMECLMMSSDSGEIADYESQAREFLAKGREYLSQGDLH